MTVTVKLITEQTTNQLAASVNKAQTEGWYPVCGILWFNARYTQLMAIDSSSTEVPKCNYFIIDSEDGIDFAQRANKHLVNNEGASCLSPVQYISARYIQAWGDDTLHHSGGGSGGNTLKWYTENAGKTYPIIDVDPNLSQIGLGNQWGGYVQLLFMTGGNNAGYILADDGTMTLHKSNISQLNMRDSGFDIITDNTRIIDATGDNIAITTRESEMLMTRSRFYVHNNTGAISMTDTPNGDQFNVLLDDGSEFNIGVDGVRINQKGVNVFASDDGYTNVIGSASSLNLGPDYASIGSPGGSLEIDVDRGIRLYDNGGVHMVIDANSTETKFGGTLIPTIVDGKSVTINGESILLNGSYGDGSIEIDANAVRMKRGSNNLLSISNSGGALTWNSIIRCAWDANGWNVSHDTGVAFSSRATYSMMQAKSGARVETNATGTSIVSSDSTSLQSSINLTNTSIVSKKGTSVSTLDATGFTMDTDGEYHYKIDGSGVFFSSGDLTRIDAGNSGITVDNGAGIFIGTHNNMPVSVSGGPLVPSSTETLGTPAKAWDLLYLDSSTPRVVQTSSAYTTPDAATIAKMANLIPHGINTVQGYMTMGYMYEDVILAFGTTDAQLYGLAWMEDGQKIVNPVAILAMEALYVRSRLP